MSASPNPWKLLFLWRCAVFWLNASFNQVIETSSQVKISNGLVEGTVDGEHSKPGARTKV
jgi:hypothetical protein